MVSEAQTRLGCINSVSTESGPSHLEGTLVWSGAFALSTRSWPPVVTFLVGESESKHVKKLRLSCRNRHGEELILGLRDADLALSVSNAWWAAWRSIFKKEPTLMQQAVRSLARLLGYDIITYDASSWKGGCPVDLRPDVINIIERVRPFTMTSPERVAAVCEAARYIASANIPGDIVECGVWRGGSTMAALCMLLQTGNENRQVYLYDTFEGMTEPTAADKTLSGVAARDLLQNSSKANDDSVWCCASLEDVTANVLAVGYPPEKVTFVKGKVEDTIPVTIPSSIALLRLDTDWYESTKHELNQLYPRLSPGGVLIIDDYGHWEGARRAVDEYFAENNISMLLNRVDYTGRVGIKRN